MNCSQCHTPLVSETTPQGMFWCCPQCKGRLATLALLRQWVPDGVVQSIWNRARATAERSRRQCPSCRNRFVEIGVRSHAGRARIDICLNCQVVWFDAGELKALPARPAGAASSVPSFRLKRARPWPSSTSTTLRSAWRLRWGRMIFMKALTTGGY